MKVKMTLIATQRRLQVEMGDDTFFRIFFTNEKKFPSIYITRGNEKETLKQLVDKYFHCGAEWLCPELLDFRLATNNECEVIYASYMPHIYDINKSGHFISDEQLEENNIEIDPYYEELLSRKSRGF